MTGVGTCATCAHWKIAEPSILRPVLSRCRRMEEAGQLLAEAWQKDGIFTASSFGCNLWEPRPAAPPSKLPILINPQAEGRI